jgi:hypothetical protein
MIPSLRTIQDDVMSPQRARSFRPQYPFKSSVSSITVKRGNPAGLAPLSVKTIFIFRQARALLTVGRAGSFTSYMSQDEIRD